MFKRIAITVLAMLMLAMMTTTVLAGKNDPAPDPEPEPTDELLPVGDADDVRYIDGKLGIGTSTPASTLDVDGNSNFRGGVNILGYGNTHFDYGDNHDAYINFGANGATIIRSFDGSAYRHIATVDDGGLEVLGNVRVEGPSNLFGTLSVFGSGNTHFDLGDNHDNYLSFGENGATIIRSWDGSGHRNIVTVNDGGLVVLGNGTFTGTVTTGSSRELKNNIARLSGEDAVNALMELVPVQYNYKTNSDELELGFIAEDVPELVARNDRKSLSPMDFAALSVTVIQEQQSEIGNLKSEIDQLKALVNELVNNK